MSAPKTELTNGVPDGHVHTDLKPNGQQLAYVVLAAEERAKGFVRPVRSAYKHVGVRPTNPTRELTADEHERYDRFGYVAYEAYPEDGASVVGRFWTQADLDSGCGATTTMSRELAETYARDPKFYGGTFCVSCGTHRPVAEFVWDGTDLQVGS